MQQPLGLNFNTKYYPNLNDVKELCATGSYIYKPEGSPNNVSLPLIVNIECYPENLKYLRLSLRGAGTADVIKSIFQIIIFYIQPN